MNNKNKNIGSDGIDRSTDFLIAGIATVVALVFAALIFIIPEQMDAMMNAAFGIVNGGTSWLWVIFFVVCMILCVWLCVGKYATKKFGDEAPDMSTFSFYAMIFVFASSASVVYWAFTEFFFYLETPPWNAAPFSIDALHWASSYSAFHWGIVPFSAYAILGVCFAYFVHVQKKDTSRVSAACAGVIGEKNANGFLGRIIDGIFLVGIVISAAGFSMGVSVPIVCTFIEMLFGIENNVMLQGIIIAVVTVCCAAAMYTGLKKGMAMISRIRTYIFFGLCLFVVLFSGNTVFILDNMVESIGWTFQHFIQMTIYTGAVDIAADGVSANWSQNWTVFFYIMMVAAVVSSGLYYANMCKGRTVRESVLGIIFGSTIGNGVIFWTIGNQSIATYLGDPETFKAAFAEDPYNAVSMVLGALPFTEVVVAAFLIYAFISTWSFVQSAIYSMAMVTQPNLPSDEEPSRVGRMYWCVVTGVLALAFLYIGGLQTVKNAMIWAGVPGLIISILIIISQFKDMKVRWGGAEKKAPSTAKETVVTE